jgi:hypothetical protein
MPRPLDKTISEVLSKYGETPKDACWDCHGVWVVYHKAIERMAARAGIAFDQPTVIEANTQAKTATIVVTGTMGDRAEWSFGEASPANNKNAYPFAMAEKRAKDRVVLKLLGLHGLAYSEDESDDFKDTAAPSRGNGRADEPDPTIGRSSATQPAGNPASRGAGADRSLQAPAPANRTPGGETLAGREAGAVKQGTAPASITQDQATFIDGSKRALALAESVTDVAEWEERNKPEAARLGFRRDNPAGVALRKAINDRIAEIELADMPAGQLEAAE